ncbi:MAG: acyl-CoA thioesterase [Bacteroidaceae bacterium]|nr:acyl-CoA thioesterase [Bacteroidaceae bacterium]MDY6250843.1 thioesterase family protein [Bacteroidaceae bacterium]
MIGPQFDEGVFRHRLPIQIRFIDVDRFGHVNNNYYFAYYDLGKQEYLKEVLHEDMMGGDLVPVVVHIDADFFVPVYYGDNIVIETRISHIGEKSFVLQQRAVNAQSETTVCQCTTIMVCYDLKQNCSVEMPKDYRTKIENYENANLSK